MRNVEQHADNAFVQNLRRGRYELGLKAPATTRIAASFAELASAM